MRVAEGAWRSRTDRTGVRYHLHRLVDAGWARPTPLPRPLGPEVPRADPDLLNRAYTALLARLSLSSAHREALHGRGLPDEEIERRGYRTLPVQGRARHARALHEQLGDALLSVPGFAVKAGKDGQPYATIAGAAGLLVPVRDTAGRVVALKVRRDDGGTGPRYSYLSSTKHGGPGPGSPVHVPLGVTGPCPCVRVTEGELKGDVAAVLSGLPTVGVAGVASWRPVLDVVRELGCPALRLAFDLDARDKPQVARPLAALAGAAAAQGLAVELEHWPADHKGIDDALAAGAAVEVLTGDAARQAVADALTAATAGEAPPAPAALDRMDDVLAEGGAPALFRNDKLLAELAALAENDPAEFACRRAQLARAGIRLRDLDRALAPRRQELRRQQPPLDAAGCYRIAGGRIVRDRPTADGLVEVALTNWSGRIVEQTVHDDGAERRLTLAIEGALADGTPLPRADVPADRFAWMRWPVEAWGPRAVVLAGAATADHTRVALQLLSGDVPRRTVYGHTGWRKIGDAWHYLHAGGAIGTDGPAAGIEVSLPDPLAGFALPAPPAGEDLAAAVRASLALLDGLAPDRLMVPLLGAVCRAALGEAPGPIDLSVHLAGPHGAGKSELAALAEQHYGAGLDARHLPGNWASTGNALEGLAFAGKDALLVIDDWAPTGTAADVQRLRREADRVFRGQGNRAGRQRMRADGSLRPSRPPRGLILSTGEDVPPGQSLRGRILVLEVSPGDVSLARLTPHQQAAAAGRFAAALAGFIRWLASQYGELRDRLPGERAALRDRTVAGTGSPRTPGIVADLALGLEYYLAFAAEAGAITAAVRDDLARRCWVALGEAAAAQAAHVQAAEPCGQFLRLLAGVIASGRGHLAGPDGQAPDHPERWGWRRVTVGGGEHSRDEWRSQGHGVGWVDGEDVFLEPEAAYAQAQELAREQGDGLAVSARTLWRHMDERGLLASRDGPRQRYTIRRRLGGHDRREVLHVRAETLSNPARPSPPSPPPSEGPIQRQNAEGAGDGRGGGGAGGGHDRPGDCPQNTAENPGGNGAGDGRDGQIRGERPPEQDMSASHRLRRRGTL
jgi:hypothetical protein